MKEDLDKNLKLNGEELARLKKEYHVLNIQVESVRTKSEPLENEIANLKVMIPSVKDKINCLLDDLDRIYK